MTESRVWCLKQIKVERVLSNKVSRRFKWTRICLMKMKLMFRSTKREERKACKSCGKL